MERWRGVAQHSLAAHLYFRCPPRYMPHLLCHCFYAATYYTATYYGGHSSIELLILQVSHLTAIAAARRHLGDNVNKTGGFDWSCGGEDATVSWISSDAVSNRPDRIASRRMIRIAPSHCRPVAAAHLHNLLHPSDTPSNPIQSN